MAAGVVDQYPTHRLSGDAEELCAVPAHGAPLIRQPEVCLVDERGSGKRVPRGLSSELTVSNTP
jgi:hypothetical protein